MASTSRIRGTLRSTTSSSVRSVAASAGRAAFLLPAGTTVPDSGWPPSMMNFSMRGSAGAGDRSSGGCARVAKAISLAKFVSARRYPARVPSPTRDEAWNLFCEWTESESLRKHVLGVEAAMVAYARKYGEDEELWAATGILHDLDYEKHPDLETGHPRIALELFEELDYPQELIDAVAGHAPYLGVPRETPLAKTLYAVDELSGFVAACALVRPTGIEGMTPKSVKKKLKTPAFAAAVNRDEVREAAAELGVDFDEHLRVVIGAMEERRDEAGARPGPSALRLTPTPAAPRRSRTRPRSRGPCGGG